MIPDHDPYGLPAPANLIAALNVVSFVLHVLPMNLLLGGSFISGFAALFAYRNRESDPEQSKRWAEISGFLTRWIPIAIAFAINLGIVPLLFLYVLYGQLFYTSSILMGWYWLTVVLLLVGGYWGSYMLQDLNLTASRRHAAIALSCGLMFAIIAFFFVNNMSLMQRPDAWHAMYTQSDRGNVLNLDDPTLWPRYFHFLIASIAVTGLWLACIGRVRSRHGAPAGELWQRIGSRIFIVATVVQMLDGLWLLMVIPQAARDSFLGGDALDTALIWSAAAAALAAIALAARNPYAAAGCILFTISAMATVRHRLRTISLEPYWSQDSLAINPQWGVFSVFAIATLASLPIMAWMVLKLWRGQEPKPPS